MPQREPTADELKTITEMRETSAKREEIAVKLGISLALVKRWIKALGLKKKPTRPVRVREPVRYADQEDGISLMDRCKIVLGNRMGEDHRGYLLDGRPASSMQIARAAGMGEMLGSFLTSICQSSRLA